MFGHSHQGFHGGSSLGPIAGFHQTMKPVGVFWDIENCPVPKGKSASSVIHFIRNFFVVNRLNHREYEFFVACDVTRTRQDISDDINKCGGVTLAHVNGNSKNASDEKLRESMKRFVDTHAQSNPTLILISGDIDFVNDLRAYQTRLGCTIIVVHGPMCSPHFKMGWNEIYAFDGFLLMMESQAGGVQGMPATGKSGQKPKGSQQQQKVACPQAQQSKTNAPPGAAKGKGGDRQNFGKGKTGNQNPQQQNKPKNLQMAGSGVQNKQGSMQTDGNQRRPPNTSADQTPSVINQNSNRFPAKSYKNQGPPSTENATIAGLGDAPVGNRPQPKIPQNPQQFEEFILMVTGLPGKMDYRILKEHLQEEAAKVNGYVKFVKNGQGFITFKKRENAERAITLFHGLEVYGKILNVQFTRSIPFENPNYKKKDAVEMQSGFTVVEHPVTKPEMISPPNGATFTEAAVEALTAGMREFAQQKAAVKNRNKNKGKAEQDNCSIQ